MKRLQNTTLNIKRVGILNVCVDKESHYVSYLKRSFSVQRWQNTVPLFRAGFV